MRYQEIPPSPPLAPFVECLWTLHDEGKPEPSEPQRILPDGCVELILNFADPFQRYTSSGPHRQPLQFLVGQMEHHLTIEPTGRVDLVGVRFRPAGAFPFVQSSLLSLTGRIEPLDSLSPRLRREMVERCSRLSPPARIRTIEKILLRRIAASRNGDHSVQGAVQIILHSEGRAPVSTLASKLGWSERQLERRFAERVGLPAKRLSRIIRFQSVFRAAERGTLRSGADLAAACGYYDQAHFIREFRQFAGESPSAFLARIAPLTEVFTRKNRVSDSYNPPA